VDANAAPVTIHSFSTLVNTLPNKFVRVAARFQADGSLVAVRLWASSNFGRLFVSPEGHVLHVNHTANTITVQNEIGLPVTLTVNADTQFFFRTPWKAIADATPICTGTACLTNLERGFKVHVSVVDPLASTLVADAVDIEIARYDGMISGANLTDFTTTRKFNTSADNYSVVLPYISSSTANGKDPITGAAISGFKWWNFTFPTFVDSGTNAITDFVNATNGGVTFGGTPPINISASGGSNAIWGDPANATGWAVPWTVLSPTRLPLGTAATGYINGNPNGSFTMQVPLGTLTVPVNMSTVSGSGTLVYQVDRTGLVVTISPIDITTTSGQNIVTQNLAAATPVKVFGVPQANGSIKAYVVFYFTGAVKPTAVD